ncbi:phosphatase PAP2 family protein [Bifidobacterium amazonense]|uniref:Phosphatase PAP2 family protein n=1 Tax=Bifidobacterium amazonense TaxID=2809027 RepID=A0ABS9VVE6_9BIFI|nr:phosphatase PAP2 family protein [Bifidobacterium amazonense]MCH9276054.1 phosphatase PAP2 family protein [Bifidobacterium amazonense]
MTDKTDEQQPIVRDPKPSLNMLQQAPSQAADPDGRSATQPSATFAPLRETDAFGEPAPAAAPRPSSQPRTNRNGAAVPGMAGASEASVTSADTDDLERGLARLDPLAVRPRTSSRVLCVVFGLLLVAAAFGVWWLGVRTETGQSYDEIVITGFSQNLPGWLTFLLEPFLISDRYLGLPIDLNPTIIMSLLIGLAGLVVMIVRRRWWLIGQTVVLAALCYAATYLKDVLPRPYLIETGTPHTNSAPSGHTILAATAAMILLLAVPRAWRAVCALFAAFFSVVIGMSVIAGGWHRPTDVAMSLLIVGGLALLALAFTRTSGMDDPGRRVSSVSVQIVATVMVTAGLLACAYAAYVIWQIAPGLALSAAWSASGAYLSVIVGVNGIAALVFGLALALRHLTAAPLTKLGLVGAPPAPPRR